VCSLAAGFSVYSGTILFSVCRGLQGIGPALMVPNALAIAGRSFTGRKKNLVFACFGACAPGGAVLGGLFAAIFAELAWWPWTCKLLWVFILSVSFVLGLVEEVPNVEICPCSETLVTTHIFISVHNRTLLTP
jgi:MFS family permease